MAQRYIPEAGDLVWLSSASQSGADPTGYRSVMVLSPAAYNEKTGLMLCCPLTTQIKTYPFEVRIGGLPKTSVLADQVKSLDWRRRTATQKGRVSPEQLTEVRAKIRALIG